MSHPNRLVAMSHPGNLLSTGYFIVNVIISAIITFGINFGIDWAVVAGHPDKNVIFSLGVFGGVIATMIILPVVTYLNSCAIKKRVDEGLDAPIRHEWFSSNILLRTVFFSMGSPRRRLLMFIINAMIIMAVPVSLILLFSCWADEGFPTSGTYECLLPETWQYCLIDATWKTHCAVILYIMNYLAVHSDLRFQGELGGEQTVEGFVVNTATSENQPILGQRV